MGTCQPTFDAFGPPFLGPSPYPHVMAHFHASCTAPTWCLCPAHQCVPMCPTPSSHVSAFICMPRPPHCALISAADWGLGKDRGKPPGVHNATRTHTPEGYIPLPRGKGYVRGMSGTPGYVGSQGWPRGMLRQEMVAQINVSPSQPPRRSSDILSLPLFSPTHGKFRP